MEKMAKSLEFKIMKTECDVNLNRNCVTNLCKLASAEKWKK